MCPCSLSSSCLRKFVIFLFVFKGTYHNWKFVYLFLGLKQMEVTVDYVQPKYLVHRCSSWLFWQKIDGDAWFTWWFFLIYQGNPSISPRTPMIWYVSSLSSLRKRGPVLRGTGWIVSQITVFVAHLRPFPPICVGPLGMCPTKSAVFFWFPFKPSQQK